MRGRLTAFAQSVSGRVAPVSARVSSQLAFVSGAARRAGGWLTRGAGSAFAGAKVALDRTLSLVERALLSPKWRERLHASSVFALIFAFGVASVDMLVTGGPELIGSARAATADAPRVDLIAATTGGGAQLIEMAALEAPSATLSAPQELVAATPTQPTAFVRVVSQPVADLPELVDTLPETIKAQPEPRELPDPRVKAEA